MSLTRAQLPAYLQQYCVDQRPQKYTAKDHAAWRYIMRQSRAYFREHAVPAYLPGLRQTGIAIDQIPSIGEMDTKLRALGWGAVAVEGFIPPMIFLDFQARRILPIASDMRSVEHIHYTPAPDIVHEAAGHAPVIADAEYSEYLTLYAAMAQKAIFAQEDLDLYEAIRALSDIKENSDSTAAMIAVAEEGLVAATSAVKFVSEANKVARMNWWTVEYGLLGDLAAPKIYGAGLLSSVAESRNCLSPKVAKRRLDLSCAETSYNITEPQPQLFVADSISHLKEVLRAFEQTLSYKRGGIYGLEQARSGRTLTTTVLDSGLSISGKLSDFLEGSAGVPGFLRFEGPVQLAYGQKQLDGQGTAQHPGGFSSPLGRSLQRPDKPLPTCTDADLAGLGLHCGKRCELLMTSGFHVAGELVSACRQDGQLLYLKWRDCTVKRGEQSYFLPAWGDFDQAIGDSVVSVYAGPADRDAYGAYDLSKPATSPGRKTPFSAVELRNFAQHAAAKELREQLGKDAAGAAAAAVGLFAAAVERDFPNDWLLRLTATELAHQVGDQAAAARLAAALQAAATKLNADEQWLVREGLALADVPDAQLDTLSSSAALNSRHSPPTPDALATPPALGSAKGREPKC